MKSIKRVIQYETVTKQEGAASLSCSRVFASPCLFPRIDFRPQGLAACLLHDAKPSSQHASGWLASSFSFVSNKQFFMNLEKSTTLSSLKIEMSLSGSINP